MSTILPHPIAKESCHKDLEHGNSWAQGAVPYFGSFVENSSRLLERQGQSKQKKRNHFEAGATLSRHFQLKKDPRFLILLLKMGRNR